MKTPCLYVCMWDSTTLLFLLLSYTWRLLLLLPPSPSLSSFSILPVLMGWYSPSWSTKLKPVHSRVPVKPNFPTTSTKRNAKKSGIKIKALGASFIWIFHTPVCYSFIFEYLCPTFYALGKVERNNFFCLGKSGKEEAINNKLFKAIAEHYRSNDKKSHSFNSEVPDQEKWRIQKTGCLELRCSSDWPQPSPPITSNHLRGGRGMFWNGTFLLVMSNGSVSEETFTTPSILLSFLSVSTNEQQSLKAGGAWAWLPSLTPVWSRANGREQGAELGSPQFMYSVCVINDKVLSFYVQAMGAKFRGKKRKKIYKGKERASSLSQGDALSWQKQIEAHCSPRLEWGTCAQHSPAAKASRRGFEWSHGHSSTAQLVLWNYTHCAQCQYQQCFCFAQLS